MQCREFVTEGGTYSYSRQCLFSGRYYVKRSDGDTRRVCGIHKNQLVREGWKVVK